MRLRSGYENRKARVEMLPLIDIVFLLLVFFIYAMLSMVVHRGVQVRLPAAATAQADRRDYVSVTVTAENEIYLGKRRVTLEELGERVGEARGDDGRPVYVGGDVRSDFGTAVEVLDVLRRAGIEEVSFESTRKAGEPR